MDNYKAMIYRLTPEMIMELIQPLSELLWDAVEGGASIGFLPPVDPVENLRYWDTVRIAVYEQSRVLLAYIENDEMIGTVQMDLATRPNARHRAEVAKLMVHRNGRRRGIATALMQEVEAVAREFGRSLLVLDTRRGDPSEVLYRKLGYVEAGKIPRYARSADGSLHTTVLFYKELPSGG